MLFSSPGRALGLAAAVALAAALVGPMYAQSLPPADLGTLGGCCSFAYGINDAGVVVGRTRTPTNLLLDNAFLWTAARGMIDLGTLGGSWSLAYGINNAGQVVGSSHTASGDWHGFLWTATGGMEDLGPGSANAISDAGQVVGSNGNAFLWTAVGGMVDLGTLGGAGGAAYDINDAGQVVGQSHTASGDQHAFLWTAARGMIDLGTLGGSYSAAYGINNAGQVVGDSSTASGPSHAFVWTAADGMVDLGTFAGAVLPLSTAQAINNAGQVAGASYTAVDFMTYHAALWSTCIPGPPVIDDASASPSVLWPPNHQMIAVRVDYTVSTSCGATATTALSVVSDESDNGHGDGNSVGDAVVVDEHTVLLRAERSGAGDGRTYTIRISSTDSDGNESTATRTVVVPKSMRQR